jgi:hypothetical protein
MQAENENLIKNTNTNENDMHKFDSDSVSSTKADNRSDRIVIEMPVKTKLNSSRSSDNILNIINHIKIETDTVSDMNCESIATPNHCLADNYTSREQSSLSLFGSFLQKTMTTGE